MNDIARSSVTVTLRLVTGEPAEMASLQGVLDAAPAYAERVTGQPPGAADAQSLFSILPDGVDYSSKFVWAVMHDATMVGCIDVIRGWPAADTALVGLLLISEPYVRRGLGTAAFQAMQTEVGGWPEIRRLRAAVVETNADVLVFWAGLGFRETGETKPYRYDKLVSRTRILIRDVDDEHQSGGAG